MKTICELKEGEHARIKLIEWPESDFCYCSVAKKHDDIVSDYPLGAVEADLTEEYLQKFSEIHDKYVSSRSTAYSIIVYGGEDPPQSIREQARIKNILLKSFIEYQGLIDLREYTRKRAEELTSDVIYPPNEYVTQAMEISSGFISLANDIQTETDAVSAISKLIMEPDRGRFIMVLGDFGVGKTFLLHKLALHIQDSYPGITPVLVEMRALEKAHSIEELIAPHFVRYNMDFRPSAFNYMLSEGRIILLFDGFDELALRVSYDRAADHLKGIVQAASSEKARIVLTSRTQHFMNDRQLMNALGKMVTSIKGHRIARLKPFTKSQIMQFLLNRIGSQPEAEERFKLIENIQELMGLSHNPRMLSFIANLSNKDFAEVKKENKEITSALLYRMLIDKWLQHEDTRANPDGIQPGLSLEDRWKTASTLAQCLWKRNITAISLSELTQEMAASIEHLPVLKSDLDSGIHQVGSGTLLIRDSDGNFSFVHQSILEWFIASRAAEQIDANADATILYDRAISPLIVEFITGLCSDNQLTDWIGCMLKNNHVTVGLRKNAQMIQQKLKIGFVTDIDFSGQDLSGMDFSGQNLTGARFTGSILKGCSFNMSVLSGCDFSGADLSDANLNDADLSDTKFDNAILKRSSFLGATLENATFKDAGILLTKLIPTRCQDHNLISALNSSTSICTSVSFGPDGTNAENLLGTAHQDGCIRIWDAATGKQIQLFKGHDSRVTSVSFSPAGSRLATGSCDKTAPIWDAATGKQIQLFKGHDNWVTSVSFSPDGSRLATGSDDKTARIWDAATGKQIQLFKGHDSRVTSVRFSPDGSRLATGSDDHTARIWDAATGKQIQLFKGHDSLVTSVSFSPDGSRLATGSDDKTARIWDAATGKQIQLFKGHDSVVTSVSFSPDGSRLATGSYDHTARIWDAATGKQIQLFKGHDSLVTSVSFSPDGSRLATGSYDKTARIWDAATGKQIQLFKGHDSVVTSVSFSPDGSRLATGSYDKTARIWDAATGKQIQLFKGHDSRVTSVSFSPAGSRLATGSCDKTAPIWDAATGKQIQLFKGHDNWVTSVSFSPDGSRLATGSCDKTARIWDAATGKQIQLFKGHDSRVTSVSFSPDGSRLATTGSYDSTARIWDAATGKQIQLFKGHDDWVTSVSFSPAGSRLATGSYDKTARIWDAATGKQIQLFKGHDSVVNSVSFSPDGSWLATGSDDNTARIWDAATGKQIQLFKGHDNWVTSVSFSPAGSRLATGSDDNTARIWDAATGECLMIFVHLPDGWVAYSPDLRYKYEGSAQDGFWFAHNLCRYEIGELDPYIPAIRRIGKDEVF